MSVRSRLVTAVLASALAAVWALVPVAATGSHGSSYSFATPLFGLDTDIDGSLLVADAGAGVVRLRHNRGTLIAELPGVSDVTRTWFGLFAVTGGSTDPAQLTPQSRKLFRIRHGKVTQLADLWAFEEEVNPDGGALDSNPFDVAALWSGSALVADAAANALLVVDHKGNIDWVATFPDEPVSTDNVKRLLNCPPPPVPPGAPDPCYLPPMIPAQAVPASVAVGPDGAYYVGELKGFPAPTGASRIWRVKPHARHARCGTSPDCTVVADGFTSIIDLSFGRDGALHVVELDEASWFAVEVSGNPIGGTVNECKRRPWRSSWTCDEEATGLTMPTAATVDHRGKVHVVTYALIPGAAEIITLR